MHRLLRRLFQVLLFIVPFAWTASTDELFEFNKMILTYGLTIIIAMVWAWRMIAEKRLIFRRTPFWWFLIAWLISQVLSTVLSIHPHTSIFGYYSRFHGGLLSSLTYVVLFGAAVSNFDREDVWPLMKSLLLGSFGIVLYALPEHFGLSPSCVLIRGDWSTNCWSEATNPRYRIFGTFGQPNWLAAYLLMTLPLSLAWTTRTWKDIQTRHQSLLQLNLVWPILTFFLSLLALLYTQSRSGFLGLVVSLMVLLIGIIWIWLKQPALHDPRNWTSSRHWLLSPLWLILGLVLTVSVIGSPYTPTVFELLAQSTAPPNTTPTPAPVETPPPTGTVLENGGTDSGKIRTIVWRGALDIWRRYPWFGSGVETFAYSYYFDRPAEHNLVSEWDFLYNKAHNEFLNILATTGAVGLATYLGLMISFIGFIGWRLYRRSDEPLEQLFLIALLAGYLGLAVSNFAGFSTVMVGILFFLWPAMAWLLTQPSNLMTTPATAKKTKSTKATANQPIFANEGQWLGAATVGLLGFLLLMNVVGMWNNDRLLAMAKQNLAQGYGLETYQQLATLTQRAPNQAEYWEQYALVLGQLAASAQSTGNSTAAASLAQEAVEGINQATTTNPVHLNIWKSRARVFIWLAAVSEEFYDSAIRALETAHQLAPTDPKILYNLALLHEATHQFEQADQVYQQAIELKPNYEQARKSYAEFLTQQQQYQTALDQYRYIEDVLKPNETLFAEEIAALEASLSAQPSPTEPPSTPPLP